MESSGVCVIVFLLGIIGGAFSMFCYEEVWKGERWVEKSKSDLRTLTRVTESHIKKSGSNPEPQTAKPDFSPPGQGKPAASTPKPGDLQTSGPPNTRVDKP